MSYLLDTDICSAFIKGDRRVWGKVMQHAGRLHVSAISAAELCAWSSRAKTPPARLQALHDFLGDLKFHPVDEVVSRKFGEIRGSQLDRGRFTPEMDLLIASTALVYDLILVTHNRQDYVEIPELHIEDWLDE